MRQYWRGVLVLLLFAALGLALWAGLCRVLTQGTWVEGSASKPAPVTTELPVGSESTLETLSRAVVPEADPYDLAERLRGWQGERQYPVATPSSQQVGARATFWVLDLASSRSYQTEATLRYAGPPAYIWVENGIDIPEAALLESARAFEDKILPVVTGEFGPLPAQGAVGYAPVTILNLHLKGADGYFSSSDLYPTSVISSSNERAMFYMAAGNGEVGSDAYNSTLAHELQHLIHWQADSNEESWVSEGLSELAELLCGYPKANRLSTFAGHPDVALTQWSADDATTSQHYSAAFLFSAYFAQRFGLDAVRRLVATGANGIAGYDTVLAALGTGLTFEDLFADWAVANYADGYESAVAPWAYDALQVSVRPQTKVSAYPAKVDGTVNPFGTDYVVFEGGGESVELGFSAASEAQLVPATPHSGAHFWWSNRADNSDMTLTRSFDLTGLAAAHLQFSLWYDIEDGWDYAYVEASPDGGRTWRVLSGTHTTMSNPTGQSYGPGYTGRSTGNGPLVPVWLEETIDLGQYAGGEVLVRFEYVTDDAVSQPGLCIDDVRIPELDYSYDVEQGDDGWVGQGFVRIDNSIPRRFLLQTFAVDGADLRLDRYWVERGRDTKLTVVTPAVVAISDVTRFADSPSAYELHVRAAQ